MNAGKYAAAIAALVAAAGLAAAQAKPSAAGSAAGTAAGNAEHGRVVSLAYVGEFGVESLVASLPSFFETYKPPKPLYPVKKYALTFSSLDFDGSPVVIRAQVYAPAIAEASARPLYLFASGTTGIGDDCAPSLETPGTKRWGWYEQNMLAYATLGFIVAFPDYTGFNDPDRPQRYFSKLAEGRMMLDAIRAAFSAFPLEGTGARPSGAVFAAGYSQGGHAAMAAADLRPSYAPDLPLTGIVTYGSTNDVEALVREGPAYAPLIFYSYMSMYGADKVKPALYLQDRWLPSFEKDASTMPVDEFQVHYGFDHKKLYRPEFSSALFGGRLAKEYPELARLLADNHTGLSGHRVPALVVQGDADFIVTTASQTKFVNALRAKGSEAKLVVFPKVSHRYTRMAGFEASVAWMLERAQAAR